MRSYAAYAPGAPLLEFSNTPDWLEARIKLLEQCVAQGYSLTLPIAQAARTPKHRRLSLKCNNHGKITLLPRQLKESVEEGICAGCRLERLTGLGMPSNAVIAAIKNTPLPATVARAARDHTKPRESSAARPGAPTRGLHSHQARLDARFGVGVISLGDAPFEGERASRQVLCLKDPSHGSWVTSPRSLQKLKGDEPCPRCRQSQFENSSDAPCQVRKPGGYLYRIVDAASSLRYIGLTTVTPEQRFQGHRDTAARGVAHPLYAAMRARPSAFKVEPLAYFWDVCDLQAAEREAIAQEGTRWPNGYNLTEGGEFGTRESPRKRLQRVLDKVYGNETVKERVLEAAYILYLNGTRLGHLYELIRKRTTPEALLARLTGSAPGSNKMASIEVRGELYTEGLVAICKEFRLCSKSVRRVQQLQGLTTGQAIEQLLNKREQKPETVVLIDGVGYASLAEAQRKLKVSYAKVKRMAQAGSSEVSTPPASARITNAEKAKKLGVPYEFYRSARKKGLLDEEIFQLGQNLRVLAGTADSSHVMVEGVTYASLDALREALGVSKSLARALAYSALSVAQAQAQMKELAQKKTPSRKKKQPARQANQSRLSVRPEEKQPLRHKPIKPGRPSKQRLRPSSRNTDTSDLPSKPGQAVPWWGEASAFAPASG